MNKESLIASKIQDVVNMLSNDSGIEKNYYYIIKECDNLLKEELLTDTQYVNLKIYRSFAYLYHGIQINLKKSITVYSDYGITEVENDHNIEYKINDEQKLLFKYLENDCFDQFPLNSASVYILDEAIKSFKELISLAESERYEKILTDVRVYLILVSIYCFLYRDYKTALDWIKDYENNHPFYFDHPDFERIRLNCLGIKIIAYLKEKLEIKEEINLIFARKMN